MSRGFRGRKFLVASVVLLSTIIGVWTVAKNFFWAAPPARVPAREVAVNPHLVFRTLKRIWPARQAKPYAQELRTHLKNMWACAVENRASNEVKF